jgi:hypothetical protein
MKLEHGRLGKFGNFNGVPGTFKTKNVGCRRKRGIQS